MNRHVMTLPALLAQFTTSGLLASAEGATFGDKPTFVSDSTPFTYSKSGDTQAFSVFFTGLEIGVGEGATQVTKKGKIAKAIGKLKRADTNAPVASRVFSIVIPVIGGTPLKTTLYVKWLCFQQCRRPGHSGLQCKWSEYRRKLPTEYG